MAAEWAPSTVRSIGPNALNRLLQVARSAIFPAEEYRNFADTSAHTCDPSRPILRGEWEMWKSVIIRPHLYEIAAHHYWGCLIARFDSRGIRSSLHLARIPFAALIKVGWGLRNKDMVIWIWQAAMGYSTPYRPNIPFRLNPPIPGHRNLIYSAQKKDIDSTQIAADYGRLKSPIGLDTSFGGLSKSGKCDLLSRAGASPMIILRLLNLGARRNALPAFAGSLIPSASRVQSYKNFGDYVNRPSLPVGAAAVRLWSDRFRSRKTFRLYLPHVMKAAIILGQSAAWLAPLVKSVANGLRQEVAESPSRISRCRRAFPPPQVRQTCDGLRRCGLPLLPAPTKGEFRNPSNPARFGRG